MSEKQKSLRDVVAQGKPPPKPPPKMPQPPARGKGKKGHKPPPKYVPPKERIVFKCGCPFTAHDLSQMMCHVHRQQKMKRDRWEKRMIERKRGDWPAVPRKTPYIYRLPPGSKKSLEWDGTVWTGTLTVPGCSDPFAFSYGSEKGCFQGLHRLYLLWVIANTPKDAAPPAETPAPEQEGGTQG